ncbi:MAG TPA: type 1 glutamine amidotransferase-like domain-containing protein [Dehalococcoidia bacterium]|nr:type 1 glutamine amidotransferase-like domain-containing protein [Dehalococcoidia bacterium]
MKKLVLYSDQIPSISEKIDNELVTMLGKTNPIIGYIPSCADPQRKYYQERQAYYARLGMDLKVYFELDKEYHPELLEPLLSCDAIHLSGGNTYYFLHWLRRRNMMDTLVQYVAQGGVLIGVSAGSILMTPDITTSSLCGDEINEGETDFSGMGLVSFAFVPHFGDRPTSLEDVKKYSQDKQMIVYAARDSGGVIVTEDKVNCIGDVIKIDER